MTNGYLYNGNQVSLTMKSPSIEYLELYGLTAGPLTWGEQIINQRIIVFCDNLAVVGMINNCASTCSNCMFFLD